PNSATRPFDTMSPKDFLLSSEFPAPPDPEKVLLAQGETTIAGEPAYYAEFRQRNFEDYPDGILMRVIIVKHQKTFYTLRYYETGNNKRLLSSFKSTRNWGLNSTFESVLSTMRFRD